jgi:YVTN family beta-propeller protein
VRIARPLSAPLLVATFLAAATLPGSAKDTGLIFVSNEKTNNIIVLDPKTNKVVKDLRTARRPRDMHLSADHTKLATGSSPETFGIDEQRRRIYVSDEEGSSLSVIDMDQNIIIQEIPTGAEPEGVFISEDGHFVYVTSEVEPQGDRVDPGRAHSVGCSHR